MALEKSLESQRQEQNTAEKKLLIAFLCLAYDKFFKELKRELGPYLKSLDLSQDTAKAYLPVLLRESFNLFLEKY